MRSPRAEADRDRLIEAILPDIPFDGWSRAALRAAAQRCGMSAVEAFALFPRGAVDLVACFSRWADRRMVERLELLSLAELRVSERVALAVRIRLEIVTPWREGVRRGLSVLAMPFNAPLALRLLYETVDAIWYAAGDTATDFNFYSKRALLAGVYGSTLLYWLEDRSDSAAETIAFLDRRLIDIAQIPRAQSRFGEIAARLPNPFALLRPAR